eukprot:842922-Pelagomonas_calceolata.AAC.6
MVGMVDKEDRERACPAIWGSMSSSGVFRSILSILAYCLFIWGSSPALVLFEAFYPYLPIPAAHITTNA